MAEARDWRATSERDRAATARDRAADNRGLQADEQDIVSDALDEAATGADRSSMVRHAAASDRGHAAESRVRARTDRTSAASDRAAAAVGAHLAAMDGLTGVYQRGPGLVEVGREIARAARHNEQISVAFIDVDHLKEVNDRHGHAAGDELLVQVADCLCASLRPYDLVIPYGGDEFVCVMTRTPLETARNRMASVNRNLAAATQHGSITAGVSTVRFGECVADAVARADADLSAQRARR